MGTGGIRRSKCKLDRTNLALYWQFDSTSEKVISSPASTQTHPYPMLNKCANESQVLFVKWLPAGLQLVSTASNQLINLLLSTHTQTHTHTRTHTQTHTQLQTQVLLYMGQFPRKRPFAIYIWDSFCEKCPTVKML